MLLMMGATDVPYTKVDSNVVTRKEAKDTSNKPRHTLMNNAPGRSSSHTSIHSMVQSS